MSHTSFIFKSSLFPLILSLVVYKDLIKINNDKIINNIVIFKSQNLVIHQNVKLEQIETRLTGNEFY